MKPFDQALYNSDDNAKMLVLAWLNKWQSELNWRVNPDQYGVDLVCDTNWTVEVEVKHSWTGHTFPYDMVHLPGRKLKFVHDGAFFVIVNNERTHALVIDGQTVASAEKVYKDTKYTFKELYLGIKLWQTAIINLTPGTDTINNLGNERTATNGDGPIS